MRKLILLLFVVQAVVGCGPKNSDLLVENKKFDDELLMRMPELVDAITRMSLTAEASCQPPGKLTYAPKSDAGDTDYVMYDELTRVGKRSTEQDSELDFHFHEGLIPSYLAWVDPASRNYIGRQGRSSERATPLLREIFRRIKNLKYLVVVKPQPVERARGEALIDVYLVDLKLLKPLCGFQVTAHADPKLGVENYDVVQRNRRTGEQKVVRSGSTDNFKGALWKDARKLVFAAVRQQLKLDTPDR